MSRRLWRHRLHRGRRGGAADEDFGRRSRSWSAFGEFTLAAFALTSCFLECSDRKPQTLFLTAL